MKRLLTRISLVWTALLLVAAPAGVTAAPYWQVTISTPSTQNTRTFGLDYTVLSTEQDSFTLELFQTGAEGVQQAQNTSGDPNAFNGNSGTFTITVPTDGTFSYYVSAYRNDDPSSRQTTQTKTVTVDTLAPDAPIYSGKTRAGNTYTLTFTAPSNPDVTQVQIYAAPRTTYQAGPETRVGVVNVTPNQKVTFAYTAPDGADRYFALRAFDGAGSGSAIVGDAGITVTPIRTVILAGAADGEAPGGAGAAGAVLGVDIDADGAGGEVDAAGNNVTESNGNTDNNGNVLGSEDERDGITSASATSWYLVVITLAFLAFAYYYFVVRRRRLQE